MNEPTPSSIAEAREIPRRSREELDAIETVKKLGHQFGFGNLMAILDGEWAKMLKEKWGVGDGEHHWLALDRRDEKASREMVLLAKLVRYQYKDNGDNHEEALEYAEMTNEEWLEAANAVDRILARARGEGSQ